MSSSKRPRPLSPHLQIYRKQITSVMSILHRISGIVLAFGSLLLALWLCAVAFGDGAVALLDTVIAKVAIAGFCAALVYHLLNGIRHLAWDAGMGFDIPKVYASGWTVVALTVALTAAIWFFILGAGGVA